MSTATSLSGEKSLHHVKVRIFDKIFLSWESRRRKAYFISDELEAYRQGIEWDPVACAREKYEAVKRKKQEEEEDRQREKQAKTFTPRTNYRQKYEHLIGTEAALDAARVAEAKGSYGMVSAEEKKDKRTVEDIQAEIRAKKKMRLAEEAATSQNQEEET